MPQAHSTVSEVPATAVDVNSSRAAAVTPNDGVDLADFAKELYVSGTGDVAVITVGGDTVTFTAVPAGTVLPIRVRRVLSTGTTATNIVAMF